MKYTIVEGSFLSRSHYPGAVYAYRIAVPEGYGLTTALLVTHDGLNTAHMNAMGALADTGEAPPCTVLGVLPGELSPTLACGSRRLLRFCDYDMFSSRYADFLTDELIPALTERHGLRRFRFPLFPRRGPLQPVGG